MIRINFAHNHVEAAITDKSMVEFLLEAKRQGLNEANDYFQIKVGPMEWSFKTDIIHGGQDIELTGWLVGDGDKSIRQIEVYEIEDAVKDALSRLRGIYDVYLKFVALHKIYKALEEKHEDQ